MKRATLCILFVLAFGRTALAATYYVSVQSGNNAVSCAQAQNQATPKKTLGNFGGNGGVSCMAAGDTLVVRAGTYPEALYLGTQPYPGLTASNPPVPNGSDDAHRTIVKAFPGEHPVITGQDPDNGGVPTVSAQFITYDGIDVDGAGQNASGIGGNGVSNATFQNFEIKNQPFSAIQMFDLGGIGLNHVHFVNLKIHDGPTMCAISPAASHAYYLGSTSGASSDIVIDRNEIYNWNCGNFNNAFVIQIYISGGSGLLMSNYQVINSYIHDNDQSAGAIGTGSNYIIANNVVARNGSKSIDPVGGFDIGFNLTTTPLIANNTFVGNTGYATGNGGYGNIVNAHFVNNILWGNGNNDTIGRVFMDPSCCTFVEDHNLQAVDPHFVNAAANDYHLQNGSPAAGAGADLSAFFTTDKDGNTRVAPWTIGAYSGQGGPPPPGTLVVSINSGPCTLSGNLTTNWDVTGQWALPGVTVSTPNPPATCTLKLHDTSPTNPAPDIISNPFDVTSQIITGPTLHFTQQPTNTIAGNAFNPPVAGTRQ